MREWIAFWFVLGAAAACGQTLVSTDAGSDAGAEVYCYQVGGPSTSPPGSPDAGINPQDCEGGKCIRSATDGYWYCTSRK